MGAALSAREERRLSVLQALRVLDTDSEREFDDIVQIATAVTGTPVALVSLVDRDRQWFKARRGLDVAETSRDVSFCAHAILGSSPLVVEDATRDDRFAENPLVTGDLGLRFYAGAPILVDGNALGTVCAIDYAPRHLPEDQLRALEALARQAATLLEVRLTNIRLAESETRFHAFMDNLPAVAFLKDADGRLRYINQAYVSAFAVDRESALGRSAQGWLSKETLAQNRVNDEKVLIKGTPIEVTEIVRNAAGEEREWSVLKFPVRLEDGSHVGGIALDVTEQRAQERKVAESERVLLESAQARFTAVFEDSGVEMAEVDPVTFKYLRVNSELSTALGYSTDELVGRSPFELTYPEDMAVGRDLLAELAQGRLGSAEFEKRYVRKDGSLVWLLVRVTRVPGLGGGSARNLVIHTDITARKEAERALRESEERLRATFENAAVGIAHVGLDGRWLLLNDAVSRITGYSREQLLTRTFGDITHPDDLEADWGLVNQILTGEIDRYSMEKRYVQPDGSIVWAKLTVSVLRDEAGNPRHFISILEDIGARKQAEAALRESEDHFRFMVDSNPQVPWTADPNGHLTDISERWTSITGIPRNEVLGTGWSQVLHPEDQANSVASWHHALATGEPYDVQFRVLRAAGDYRWFRARAVARRDSEGLIVRWYGSVEDIHVRKEAETRLHEIVAERTHDLWAANEALTLARDAALAASRSKSQFLANMSHEIRTPMNGVIGTTSLLQRETLTPHATELVRTIASSGRTLLRVIDDILDLSKIEADHLEIVPASVSLEELTTDVVALHNGPAFEKGIALTCESLSGSAPRVMTDPVRLRQVLSNLVSNAVKFTERGEVALTWTWAPTATGLTARFTVTDTGIGIPADRLANVFESFTQADGSVQRQYGGTGLGLTISKRLVELMKGVIGVLSEPGTGSTFFVELPLELAPAGTSDVEPAGRPSSKELAIGLRVLLAEDNEVNVLVATAMLEELGCDVDFASDGLEAIERGTGSHYDVILMDVQMPRCDGLQAARKIRDLEAVAKRPRVPIVALTANAMAEDREACLAAGMSGFLPKPITFEALRQALIENVR